MISAIAVGKLLRTAAVVLFGLTMLAMSLTGCQDQDRVTVENQQRVRPGMTFEEVVDILGPDYEKKRSGVSLGDVEVSVEHDVYVWRQDGRRIEVEFDDNVVEESRFYSENPPVEPEDS